jgi:cellulose synthase/poly-beta-1,6-N-acetylglucosamine synthase-like glycosyltransferase
VTLLFFCYAGTVLLLLLGYGAGQFGLRYYWRKLSPFVPPADYRPRTRMAVLVPARNEAAVIDAIVTDLLAQNYPQHLCELVVIDDHSTDTTASRVAAYAERGVRLLSLADELRGRPVVAYKKAALAYGVAATTGELLVTTDADCRLPPGWLRTLAYAYETQGYDFLTAPVRIAPTPDFLTTFQALDLAAFMLLTGATAAAGRPLLANGANLAFTRRLFTQIGGYAGLEDRASGDDVLLLHKVTTRRAGRVGFVQSASATVDTRPVASWRALWRQRLRWAAKTSGYADRWLVVVQGSVYLLCLGIVAGLIAGLFGGAHWVVAAVGIWLAKASIDYVQLRRLSRHFGRPAWMRYYGPVQLLYPFYIVVVGTVALLQPRVGWKGRKG